MVVYKRKGRVPKGKEPAVAEKKASDVQDEDGASDEAQPESTVPDKQVDEGGPKMPAATRVSPRKQAAKRVVPKGKEVALAEKTATVVQDDGRASQAAQAESTKVPDKQVEKDAPNMATATRVSPKKHAAKKGVPKGKDPAVAEKTAKDVQDEGGAREVAQPESTVPDQIDSVEKNVEDAGDRRVQSAKNNEVAGKGKSGHQEKGKGLPKKVSAREAASNLPAATRVSPRKHAAASVDKSGSAQNPKAAPSNKAISTTAKKGTGAAGGREPPVKVAGKKPSAKKNTSKNGASGSAQVCAEKEKKNLSQCKSRCSFRRIYKTFESMNLVSKPSLAEKITNTPFGFLLKCPRLKLDAALLSAIVMVWDKNLQGCRISGSFIPFTVDDVAKIMGLPATGSHVVLPSDIKPDDSVARKGVCAEVYL